MNYKVSDDFEKTIKEIQQNFDDALLKERRIMNSNNPKISFSLLYFVNLSNKDWVSNNIIKPILEYPKKFETTDILEIVKNSVLFVSEVIPTRDLQEVYEQLLRGKSVLVCSKNDYVLIVDTEDRKNRSILEPDIEQVLRGPREGFLESMGANIALVRNKIANSTFRVEYYQIGVTTKTRACICYVEDKVDKDALRVFRERLAKYKPDGVMDTNTIAEAITDFGKSPFKTYGLTERPDVAAAKMIEGKLAFMLDGTPSVVFVPYLFVESFHTSEDYYLNFTFVSIGRVLRILGFLISIILPGLYVSIVTYHWEIIPSPIIFAVLQSQQGVPFPTVVECALLLVVFELLRESGQRAPSGLGQSISVVGAIVVGQAAVEARLVSTTMIFIIALTAISGLITTKLKGGSIVLRFFYLLVGSLLGLYGILLVSLTLLAHLLRLQSFGVQYMERLFPLKPTNILQGLLRYPKKNINKS